MRLCESPLRPESPLFTHSRLCVRSPFRRIAEAAAVNSVTVYFARLRHREAQHTQSWRRDLIIIGKLSSTNYHGEFRSPKGNLLDERRTKASLRCGSKTGEGRPSDIVKGQPGDAREEFNAERGEINNIDVNPSILFPCWRTLIITIN